VAGEDVRFTLARNVGRSPTEYAPRVLPDTAMDADHDPSLSRPREPVYPVDSRTGAVAGAAQSRVEAEI
jgi:hypothetical protein